MLNTNDRVILDGLFHAEVVHSGLAGVHHVRVVGSSLVAVEPFIVRAVWDGETRGAATGEPLMVTVDAGE